MKKLLMTTLMGISLLGVEDAVAERMQITALATRSDNVARHNLESVNRVQTALLSVAPVIVDVLKRAEHLGLNTATSAVYTAADLEIAEGSIAGIGANPSTDNAAITFTLRPGEIHPSSFFANDVTLTYTPVTDNGTSIVGWRCVSTVADRDYSPSWDRNPSVDQIDPVLSGLGYPLEACIRNA